MKEYVCGLLFSHGRKTVALIEKSGKGEFKWQGGLFNGLGGVVEEGEMAVEAMNREFKEEAGVENILWEGFLILECHTDSPSPCKVHFYRAFSNEVMKVKSMTEEKVGIFKVEDVLQMPNVVHNLRWLIPLALDRQVNYGVVRLK